jgi:hypothetical protein
MATAILGEPLQQEKIVRMRTFNWDPGRAGERRGAAGVVEMTMGEEHFFERQALTANRIEEARYFAAGVYDRGLAGLAAPNERAILPEGRDRKDRGVKRRFRHFHRIVQGNSRILTQT